MPPAEMIVYGHLNGGFSSLTRRDLAEIPALFQGYKTGIEKAAARGETTSRGRGRASKTIIRSKLKSSDQRKSPGVTSMAMTMNGEVQLDASRQVVWDKLNDPTVLKACIPGCEELEATAEGSFRAIARMRVGPVSALFKGNVKLSDLDPPNGYRIAGQGEGGIAGFAKGGAVVGLSEKEGGTLLTYSVEAQIGGKLAQLGQRLVQGTAKRLADEFFTNFAKEIAERP